MNSKNDAVEIVVPLGPVDTIPLGQGCTYVVDGCAIAVFRQRDGQLFATHNACPHRGGPLADGIIGNGQVICPLHSRQFDLTTGESADCAVRTCPVRVEDDEIILTLA
ncbi:MAG: nitrite reductase (NAD(P)H) small subunit [Candidatus Methylomirabilota bacterium]|nr:MAG: nitrite reductase (NAD(P)H) small subunit [candidate division NC10 bacterium]